MNLGLLLLVIGLGVTAPDEKPAAGPAHVAVTVDNEAIGAGEVEREIALALKGQKLAGEALARLRKHALEQVIDRHLVLRYLQTNKQAASKEDVDFALARLVRQLKAKDKPLADHLKTIGMSEAELRQELLWKISWARYVEARTADENLKKYFDMHRSDFDGSELKVAHILLTVPAGDDAKLQTALQTAAAIREEITSSKVTFADAAKKHSQAPTAKGGGNIGGIRRREPMPEEFSRAAFALKKGEVSQPVVTAFGVHLIHAHEIIPGQRTWEDCREELRPAVTLYLFRWIAEKERKGAKVTY
ncbi:MAG: peptidylprolyl isomerase [Pirellulaceae bacterium]|nr:peptidylprolyl isomerase [Pirellulaceae bacterium]